MKAIRIEPGELSGLRAEVRGSPQARRLHRIHAVLLVAAGLSCRTAARLLGDSPRAVEYWVDRYNNSKMRGLYDSHPSGRPARLNAAQWKELRAAVSSGAPSPGAAGWRGEDVSVYVSRRWSVVLGLRQAQRLLSRIRASQ